MKETFKYIILSLTITVLASSFVQNAEYEAKLAYVDRFTKFITWPNSNNDLGEQFKIGIIDKNPFGEAIKILIKTKKIKGKSISYEIIDNLNSIKNVDLLFIPEDHSLPIDSILSHSQSHGVMIISEKKGYIDKGIMINLQLKYGELKFEINKKVIDNQGFTVHSKLYQVASKVVK